MSLLLNGLGMVAIKLVSQLGLSESTPLLMTLVYGTAALLSLVHLMVRRPSVHLPSLAVGMVTGVSSIIGLFASIKAAAMLPAYIVFPVSSCGTIFLVAAAGRFVFREKIGPCGMAGIALGIAAIAFLAG